jgi:hypothetical protein
MTMGYVTCIGRIGGLAVALGLGAGLAATPWMASATPADSGSSNSSSSSHSASGPSPSVKSSTTPASGSVQHQAGVNGDTSAVGRSRPLRGTSAGATTIDLATGALTGHESAVISHLGKVQVSTQGVSTPNGDGTYTDTGTVTLVTANGDKLFGTFTGTVSSGPNNVTVVTITGGTGRFTNASGTVTVNCDNSFAQQGQTLVMTSDCIENGQIRY